MSASPSPSAPLDVVARLRAVGCIFAEDEARLLTGAARTPAELAVMVDRRAAGEPLEHVLGWAEFCGLRIAVEPGVFIPRRRTEFLVRRAVALSRAPASAGRDAADGAAGRDAADGAAGRDAADGAAGRDAADGAAGRDAAQPPAVVVDLCCGSGAVGAALAAALGRVELHAADIDPVAVRCARRNVAPVGGRVYQGDLYGPLPGGLRGRVSLLAANVPYVPTGEVGLLPPEARVHEPRVALDGGADGLDVLRRVTAAAPRWLAPGGHLLVETSERQAPQAVEIFARDGLIPRVTRSAKLHATVVTGTRPGRRGAPGG
jgi:release factor glutamine methyltransferase